MIVFVVFCLIVLTDIIHVLRHQKLHKEMDKNLFIQTVFLLALSMFGITLLSKLFHLQLKYIIYLSMVLCVSVLLLISFALQEVKMKREFEDISQYMLRVCVYFRAHKKIYLALIDAKTGFEGSFKVSCEKVVENYNMGVSLEDSMIQLTDHYLMKSLVEILDSSEHIGNMHSEAQLSRLEYDIEHWIFQTKSFQKEERKHRNKMLLLFLIGLVISFFAQNMLMQSIDMKNVSLYQKLMFVFLASNITAVVLLSRRLCQSWFLKKELL